jgi:hypothetical protein
MAEVLGTSGKSRVKDLLTNSGNPFTPAYAIYEDGRPVKMALFNYMSDSTGASDYRAEIQVPSQVTSVRVKLLRGDTVSSVSGFTWAGQVRINPNCVHIYILITNRHLEGFSKWMGVFKEQSWFTRFSVVQENALLPSPRPLLLWCF